MCLVESLWLIARDDGSLSNIANNDESSLIVTKQLSILWIYIPLVVVKGEKIVFDRIRNDVDTSTSRALLTL